MFKSRDSRAMLFEQGFKLENTQNKALGICIKALRTRLIISPMLLFMKTLRTAMTLS